MSQPDTEQTYQALRRAILRAQEAGMRPICEAFTMTKGGVVVGCCASEALQRFDSAAYKAAPDDGIRLMIRGFDGLELKHGDEGFRQWHVIGLRLRDEFRPITATELERELGVTS